MQLTQIVANSCSVNLFSFLYTLISISNKTLITAQQYMVEVNGKANKEIK